MDIANITALARTGYNPAARAGKSETPRRAEAHHDGVLSVARQHEPVEYVVQGELLRKPRAAYADDGYSLLDSLRDMDRFLRENTSSAYSDTTQARDTRRALAAYSMNTPIPNTQTGATAAVHIDYFV